MFGRAVSAALNSPIVSGLRTVWDMTVAGALLLVRAAHSMRQPTRTPAHPQAVKPSNSIYLQLVFFFFLFFFGAGAYWGGGLGFPILPRRRGVFQCRYIRTEIGHGPGRTGCFWGWVSRVGTASCGSLGSQQPNPASCAASMPLQGSKVHEPMRRAQANRQPHLPGRRPGSGRPRRHSHSGPRPPPRAAAQTLSS